MTSRLSVVGCRAALVAVFLSVIVGCGAANSPGKSDRAGEEEVGHVIPAHKPRAFPQAVRRLRELNDQFVRELKGPVAGSSTDEKNLRIALDIANWLPEIAAGSDMPEPPWNKVNVQSAILSADFQSLLSAKVADHGRELASTDKAVSELETVLAAADPRWFDDFEEHKPAP